MLRSGETTACEITESVFNCIREREDEINAYISITEEDAMEKAREVDRLLAQGKHMAILAGIPVAIKDSITIKNGRTTCGAKILDNFISPYDATVIEKLRAADVVFTGKTNTDEFTMGSSTETSYYGVTRNPHDTSRIPGGSSGGSAAAVATNEAILALGSDTGGSIRQPSAFCGVVGMKPTYGRVSRYGLIAHASSLDQIGSIARTVEDCALLLTVIAGHDKMDSTSANIEVPDYTVGIDSGVKGLKIGLPEEYFGEGLDPTIERAIKNSAERLALLGAEVVEISLPHTPYAIPTYYLLSTAEASANLARYDGVKYGYRATGSSDLMEMYLKSRSEGFGSEVKRRIMLGTYCLSAGYYDAYYRKAQKVRHLIKNDFETAFKTVDVIMSPVSPIPPIEIGSRINDPLQMYLMDVYTISLNLAGLPGISLPCGKDSDGLPIGLQIMGKPFDETTLFRMAYTLEQSTAHDSGNDS